MADSEDDDYFGPALPPAAPCKPSPAAATSSVSRASSSQNHRRRRSKSSSSSSSSDSSSDSSSSSSDSSDCQTKPKAVKVSHVPSNVQYQKQAIGPQIIPQMPLTTENTGKAVGFIGPVIPGMHAPAEESGDDSDSDCIGPMPATDKDGKPTTAGEEFARRAQRMKDRLLGNEEDSGVTTRETWMTELPSVEMKNDLGLTARQFRKGAGFDPTADRSQWTDTPEDKERKAQDGETSAAAANSAHVPSQRDQFFAEQVTQFNETKRTESLFEMHQRKLLKKRRKEEKKEKAETKKRKKKEEKKKRKKEKKEEKKEEKKKKDKKSKVGERRPFDRDLDLQSNRMDAAKRKSLIKRSMELNTKFGKGKTQFL